MRRVFVLFLMVFFLAGFSNIYAQGKNQAKAQKPFYIIFDKNFIEHSLKGLTGCRVLKVGMGEAGGYGNKDFYYLKYNEDKLSVPSIAYTFLRKAIERERKWVERRGYNAIIVQDVNFLYGMDTNDSMSIINGKMGTASITAVVTYIEALIKCSR